MTQHRWRDSPDVVARLIDKDRIISWKSKDIVLKPNEACAIIQDGKIRDILTETVMKNQVGGFGSWLANSMGLGKIDNKLLFAITGPVTLNLAMIGQLANGEEVKGVASLRIQFQRDHLPKLLNLFTNGPREITRSWLSSQLQREFDTRVVHSLLSTTTDVSALRSPSFQENFEMRTEVEMRNVCQLWGVTLLKSFCSTDPTDLERVEKLRAKMAAKTEQGQVMADTEIAALERHESVMLRRIEVEYSQAQARARGQVAVEVEAELKELRAEEIRWEAELKVERQRHEMNKDDRQHKTEQAMDLFAQVQEAKRARMSQHSDSNLQRQQHTDEVQTRMMELAAEKGALTPEVMQSFLDNQSTQKHADQPGQSPVATPSSTESGTITSQATMQICNCGQVLQNTWTACPMCGKQL